MIKLPHIVKASAVLLLCLLLSGCVQRHENPPLREATGGSTAEEAQAAWLSSPAVSEFTFETVDRTAHDMFGDPHYATESSLRIDIDRNYHVADPEGLVRELAQTAWSIKTSLAPEGVFKFYISRGVSSDFSWLEAQDGVFGAAHPAIPSNLSRSATPFVEISANTSHLETVFGEWAATPIKAPSASLFAEGAPSTVNPGLTQIDFWGPSLEQTDSTKQCYHWEAHRNADAEGNIYGVPTSNPSSGEDAMISLSITKDGQKLAGIGIGAYPDSSVQVPIASYDMCIDKSIALEGLVFTTSAPATDYFEEVIVEVACSVEEISGEAPRCRPEAWSAEAIAK